MAIKHCLQAGGKYPRVRWGFRGKRVAVLHFRAIWLQFPSSRGMEEKLHKSSCALSYPGQFNVPTKRGVEQPGSSSGS